MADTEITPTPQYEPSSEERLADVARRLARDVPRGFILTEVVRFENREVVVQVEIKAQPEKGAA